MAELLNQVQDNKDNMKKHISDMIQSTILPNLNALEDQIGQNVNIELLRITISGLINEDDKFLYNFTQLSQRELELCYLIKIGLSSKEIAEKFSISSKTVDKHRANIRTKLGIVGKKKNLSTSLLFLGQRK
jgi:DNA-binding NarL/FixJ family response regulator